MAAATSNALRRGMAQTPDGDMHSDFQPQVKASPAASVSEQIQQDIQEHKVFVYMKVCLVFRCLMHGSPIIQQYHALCRAILRHLCADSATWFARFLMHTVRSFDEIDALHFTC